MDGERGREGRDETYGYAGRIRQPLIIHLLRSHPRLQRSAQRRPDDGTDVAAAVGPACEDDGEGFAGGFVGDVVGGVGGAAAAAGTAAASGPSDLGGCGGGGGEGEEEGVGDVHFAGGWVGGEVSGWVKDGNEE